MFYVAYRNDGHDSLYYATDSARDMADRLGISVRSLHTLDWRLRTGRRKNPRILVYSYTDQELDDLHDGIR